MVTMSEPSTAALTSEAARPTSPTDDDIWPLLDRPGPPSANCRTSSPYEMALGSGDRSLGGVVGELQAPEPGGRAAGGEQAVGCRPRQVAVLVIAATQQKSWSGNH